MVLNPALFRRLQERLGEVRISNEGEALIAQTTANARLGRSPTGKPKVTIVHSGERYMVNCPKCGDTRLRLGICHRANEYPWLIHCHNADCYSSRQTRDQLLRHVFRGPPPKRLPVGRGVRNADAGQPPEVPDGFQFLHELPLGHKARTYLAERGYDPVEVCELHGVGYCGDHTNPNVRDRLVVPIVCDGKLAGWQTRFIGERNWKATEVPKYWTAPGTRRNLALYGLDHARRYPFAVLVEGVTDVWSVGPWATAMFGKDITFGQRRLIAFALKSQPLVVMLDADARAENHAIVAELRSQHSAGVVLVDLPEGTDPGDLSREANLRLIHAAARAQGVSLEAV